jgi:sterol O-acyltransferase
MSTSWPFMLHWAWTAQVFFTLHALVILMKMHSYAFYNGHLGETERRLVSLDKPESALMTAAIKYPTSPSRVKEFDSEVEFKKREERRQSLTQLREDLATELTSPLGRVTFPQNLTGRNYVDYVLCPTLCYELEYPRTKERRWMELFWKTLAVFGCIFLLTLVSEEFIVPELDKSTEHLRMVDTLIEKGLILSETISMLLFPFTVVFLLVFILIFEFLLGAFAEITCFADRHFYSDWWNSCDW